MPVLDAKALKSDRKGLAFLRAVLSGNQSDDGKSVRKPKAPRSKLPSLRSFLNVNR